MAEGQWSIDIERAWANLFRLIVQQMSRAYADLEVVTLQTVLGHLFQTPDQVSEERFPSAAQSRLILASWQEIQIELDQIGFETFKQLFVANSDIKACCAFKALLLNNPVLSKFLQLTGTVTLSGLLPRHEKSEQQ